MKVAVSPTFRRVVVCKFQTTLTGSMSMTISVKMFGILPYLKKASLLIQRAPGICGFQLAAKGLHAAIPEITVAIVNAIRIEPVNRTAMRMFLVGKRR